MDKGLQMGNCWGTEWGEGQAKAGKAWNVGVRSWGAPEASFLVQITSFGGRGCPGPLIQGKTYVQVQLILEIFIDHIEVTVILKSMQFLLEKKVGKKAEKRTKLH